MQRRLRRLPVALLLACAAPALAQQPGAPRTLTWQEVRQEFTVNNPQLLAGKLTIDESRADEITAFLRPNPGFTISTDGTQIAKHDGIWRPFSGTFVSPQLSYLHEREHKRELRLAVAQKATAIAISDLSDLERNLTFNLRDAFVRVLQAKAVHRVAQENLDYYDKEISINRERFSAGAIAKVDFQRVELQRVQYEIGRASCRERV